jgi:hypothetical protein
MHARPSWLLPALLATTGCACVQGSAIPFPDPLDGARARSVRYVSTQDYLDEPASTAPPGHSGTAHRFDSGLGIAAGSWIYGIVDARASAQRVNTKNRHSNGSGFDASPWLQLDRGQSTKRVARSCTQPHPRASAT